MDSVLGKAVNRKLCETFDGFGSAVLGLNILPHVESHYQVHLH